MMLILFLLEEEQTCLKLLLCETVMGRWSYMKLLGWCCIEFFNIKRGIMQMLENIIDPEKILKVVCKR